MSYQTGTAANADDFFDKLRTFLTVTVGWTELQYEAGNPKRMLLKAPGLSGLEEIFIGFRKYEDVPGDTYGIYCWMARAYDAGLDMEAQPGTSSTRFLPLWDSSTPYWFMANGQRVILTAKVSTTYWSGYAGKFLPYGTTSEYGTPFYMSMAATSAVRYSTISENVRSFFDPNNGLLCLPSGDWQGVGNFYESSGESPYTAGVWIHPYHDEASATRTRYREIRDNPDGSYQLFPLVILGDLPSYDIYGELDGAFACSAFSAASEDIMTVGATPHILIQNGFRTARYYFCAIQQG